MNANEMPPAGGTTIGDFSALMGLTPAMTAEALGLSDPSPRGHVPAAAAWRHLESRGVTKAFRVIAHVNMRGGIGKTTASVALAERAAQIGRRVCLLDLDSQASASLALGVTAEEDDAVFYDIWQDPEGEMAGALREITPDLSLIPSSLQNGLLDSALGSPVSQKNAVRGVTAALEALGFDLVVIDCPPSLGAAVISTICAANAITIPTGADAFSFKGIEITLREIGSICDTFHIAPPEIGILYSRYDRREKSSIEALERLRREYPAQLLSAVIRTSAEYVRTLERGGTIFGASGRNRAKEDYDGYLRAVLGIEDVLSAAPELIREVAPRANPRSEDDWEDSPARPVIQRKQGEEMSHD
jgi:chromosome partitioning protein